ncbi:MAG TPA: hypothetical protein HA330_00340 [Candidatus Thalassarchaeaceae archaeon]|nr:MAG TPA: hypothetical protein D7H85_00340 [Candidatus Poseidoniales archaeon]HII48309.1 hypothetical protein [Candidatus Thalassarchaeaceae archaeon]
MSRRSRNRRIRDERAQKAVDELSTILLNHDLSDRVRITAARDLVRTARRHNSRLPDSIRHWICRSCHNPMLPGAGARIRIRCGFRITTCTICGQIRRFPIKEGEE